MKSKISRYELMKRGGMMIFLLGALVVAAHAESSLLPPQEVIHVTSERLKETLGAEPAKLGFVRANQIVEELIEPHVDFDRVSALVLGKHWKTASPDQKERFKKEFRNMLVRTYATAYTEFTDWSIRYLPLKMEEGEQKVMVKTEVLQPGRPPVAVDYRMIHAGTDWKVYDVVIEGISLVANYRTTFKNEVARSGSLDSVIERLAKRNSEAATQPEKLVKEES